MLIAEVSKKYDVSADTLRYYERIGLLPPVTRSAGGIRDYSDDDCNWVDFIKHMRAAGVSIEALIEYVSLFREGNATIPARKQLLQEQRRQLAERIEKMQETLARLDWKIDGYEERVLKCEEKLKRPE